MEWIQSTRREFIRTALMAAPVVCLSGLGFISEASAAVSTSPSVDLRFITSKMALRRRYEWSRIKPNPARLRLASLEKYNRITVHHEGCGINVRTSTHSVEQCLDGVLGGHLRRNFGDIGYHFVVDYAGRVWEGRSLGYWGAHVSGQNDQNVGVMLLGNFEMQRPSKEQLDALQKMVLALRTRFNVRPGRVYGHIDLGKTLCPGRYLYGQVAKLNQ